MNRLFEYFPVLEVFVRIVYKQMLAFGFLKRRIIPKDKKSNIDSAVINISLDDILNGFDIQKGDILIVHSSMSALKVLGLSPAEIIDKLLEKTGTEGTLVMPTYPVYPKHSASLNYEEEYKQDFLYDVNKSEGWTGIITEKFRLRNGVVRSNYPNNTLAASGKYSEEMFINELKDDVAFGPCSAWRFCSDHHAKILFLGIHAHHSISEIHIAEDMLDKKWPIKGWYANKTFRIVNKENSIKKICRVRKDYWTKYLTEYRCCYELRKNKLLEEKNCMGIPVSFIPDVYKLEKFVTDRALKGDLLIFKIPKKFWRK